MNQREANKRYREALEAARLCKTHAEGDSEYWGCMSCLAEKYYAEERERICRIIDANVCKCTEDCTRIDMFGDDLIALIRGERVAHLENLRRLADETGEYDSFYNPLIKGGDK